MYYLARKYWIEREYLNIFHFEERPPSICNLVFLFTWDISTGTYHSHSRLLCSLLCSYTHIHPLYYCMFHHFGRDSHYIHLHLQYINRKEFTFGYCIISASSEKKTELLQQTWDHIYLSWHQNHFEANIIAKTLHN